MVCISRRRSFPDNRLYKQRKKCGHSSIGHCQIEKKMVSPRESDREKKMVSPRESDKAATANDGLKKATESHVPVLETQKSLSKTKKEESPALKAAIKKTE